MTSRRAHSCETVVIGAGPYGLSVAAHLAHAGVDVKVFGEPMAFWRHNMPAGMLLRSPWRATHLSDPDGALTLDAYAAAHRVDSGKLLPLTQFVAYGEWFWRHALADIDRRAVRLIDAKSDGFRLTLEDGEVLQANRVVVATGLRNQEFRPAAFRDLPPGRVSHSSEHTDLTKWRGQRVAVIGRGQSACESAALLAEAGSAVEIVSRGDIHWLGIGPKSIATEPMTLRLRKMLRAPSEVGPFPLSWLVEAPGLVRHLPATVREAFTQRCLKAGAAGWLRPRFSSVIGTPGTTIKAARATAGGIALDLDDGTRTFDHVLLGTGYRVDIARLGILSPELLQKIVRTSGSPLLGAGFESSVPNLHFVGSYAVKSFGPLLRFIAGAPFAARAVARAARREIPSTHLAPQAAMLPTAAPHLAPWR
jgi:FAD-dependent urate hydroxylase